MPARADGSDGGLFGGDATALITALRPLASRPGLVSIFVGKKRVGQAREGTVIELGLHVGGGWTSGLAQRVERAARADAAERDGARFVSRRARSEAAVRAHLQEKGHDEEAVHEAIRRLRSIGAINDAALAQDLVRAMDRRGPSARRAVAARGERARLPSESIDAAIRARGEIADADLAVRLVRDRLPAWLEAHGPTTAARRALALLARRGFAEEEADHAVRLALREAGVSSLGPEE